MGSAATGFSLCTGCIRPHACRFWVFLVGTTAGYKKKVDFYIVLHGSSLQAKLQRKILEDAILKTIQPS